MQVELGGMLASLLSQAGMSASDEVVIPVTEFQQILNQLSAAIEEQESGQLPLKSQTLVQWIDQLGVSLEDQGGEFRDNLKALHAQLKLLLQQVDGVAVWPQVGQPGDPLPETVLNEAVEDFSTHEDKSPISSDGEELPKDWASLVMLVPPVPEVIPGGEEQVPLDTAGGYGLASRYPPYPQEEVSSRNWESLVTLAGPLTEVMGVGQEGRKQPDTAGEMTASIEAATVMTLPPDNDKAAEATKLSAISSAPLTTAVEFPREGGQDELLVESPPHQEKPPSGGDESAPPIEVDRDFQPLRLSPTPETHSVQLVKPVVRPALDLTQSFDRPEWADELGERLLWLHGKSVQMAELRIHPQHLGPVEVRIRVSEDQTNIQFASPHAVVREAIETALPRLREMFAAQQLQLAHVEIGQHFASDQHHSHGEYPQGRAWEHSTAGSEAELADLLETNERQLPTGGNHLLSLYA